MADQEKLAFKATLIKSKRKYPTTKSEDKKSKLKGNKQCTFCFKKNYVSSSCWKKNKKA